MCGRAEQAPLAQAQPVLSGRAGQAREGLQDARFFDAVDSAALRQVWRSRPPERGRGGDRRGQGGLLQGADREPGQQEQACRQRQAAFGAAAVAAQQGALMHPLLAVQVGAQLPQGQGRALRDHGVRGVPGHGAAIEFVGGQGARIQEALGHGQGPAHDLRRGRDPGLHCLCL